jgi:hypothetical protein
MQGAERAAVLTPFLAYGLIWLDLGAVGVLGLLAAPLLARWMKGALVAIGGLLLVGAAAYPLAVPNHHFVLGYLAVLLVLNGPDQRASRWLYAALMGMAALQKALSPAYADGSYMAWLTLDGGLVAPIMGWIPGWEAIAGANQELVRASAHPASLPVRTLVGPAAGLPVFGLVASWVVIGVEALLAALVLARSRAFAGWAVAFVVLLPLVRPEYIFASTLSAPTGLALPPARWRQVCLAWAVVMGVAALVLER